MEILAMPLKPEEALRLAVASLFAIVIIFSFLYGTVYGWIRRGYRESISEIHKEPTKIIGGLSVLLVALIADHAFIYCVSLFIGGLLIASEQFMIALAAIFNSDRKSVHKISKHWTDMSNSQIEDKQAIEAEDSILAEKEASAAAMKKESPTSIRAKKVDVEETKRAARTRLEEVKAIETKVLNLLETRANTNGYALQKYVRRVNDEGISKSYDAIAVDEQSGQIRVGIEVVYRPRVHPETLYITLDRIARKYSKTDIAVLIAIVSRDYNLVSAQQLDTIRKDFQESHTGPWGVTFLKDNDGNLEVLDSKDLELAFSRK